MRRFFSRLGHWLDRLYPIPDPYLMPPAGARHPGLFYARRKDDT